MTAGSIDVLIRGAKIVDGTGNPWRYGDVAIQGERILEVAAPGRISPEAAREVVDAAGMVVCPGFIDILSHSHIPLIGEREHTTFLDSKDSFPFLHIPNGLPSLYSCL